MFDKRYLVPGMIAVISLGALVAVLTLPTKTAEQSLYDAAEVSPAAELGAGNLALEDSVARFSQSLESARELLRNAENALKEDRQEKQPEQPKASSPVWQLLHPSEAELEPVMIPLDEKITEFQVVVIEPRKIFPGQGEQLELPLLGGDTVTVAVQSTHTSRNGDVSWSGHLALAGDEYPVVYTQGKHSTYAMITTPEGSYSMESVNGVGWLYKNPSEQEMSQPGAQDFLEIAQNRVL